MQRVLVAGLLLFTAVSLGNSEEKKAYAFSGAGTFDCTEFANIYRKDSTLAENMFFSWAQGFMSGLNAIHLLESHTSANLNSMPTEDQQLAIRFYCNAHPLAPYVEAVMDLYKRFPPNKSVASSGAQ